MELPGQDQMNNISDALKLRCCRQTDLKLLDQVITPCLKENAQHHNKTSLLNSLQKSTPKTYKTCLHLNLQKQLQIQLKFRGLSAKLHLMNFRKGSVDENIITTQLLVQNYPKIIYDMGNLQADPISKF